MLDFYDLIIKKISSKNGVENPVFFYTNKAIKWVSSFIKDLITQNYINFKFMDFTSFVNDSDSFYEQKFDDIKLTDLGVFEIDFGLETEIKHLSKSSRINQFGVFGDYSKEELFECIDQCKQVILKSGNVKFKILFYKLILNNKNIRFFKEISDTNLILLSQNLSKFEINKINATYLINLFKDSNSSKAKASLLFSLFKVFLIFLSFNFKYDTLNDSADFLTLESRKEFLQFCINLNVGQNLSQEKTNTVWNKKNRFYDNLKNINLQIIILEELYQVFDDFALEFKFDPKQTLIEEEHILRFSNAKKLKSNKKL
jgi:hypothetical protein